MGPTSGGYPESESDSVPETGREGFCVWEEDMYVWAISVLWIIDAQDLGIDRKVDKRTLTIGLTAECSDSLRAISW